jgi:predicted nucleic acid-binding protein
VIRILLDADLILEALMNRHEFTQDIRELLDRVHPLIEMYITDVGWQKIYAYARCLKNSKIAEIVVYWLKAKIEVCQIDQHILQKARSLPLRDFESAVEFSCARYWQLDAIVTHKQEDFAVPTNKLWVWSIADLCLRANLENQLHATISS